MYSAFMLCRISDFPTFVFLLETAYSVLFAAYSLHAFIDFKGTAH